MIKLGFFEPIKRFSFIFLPFFISAYFFACQSLFNDNSKETLDEIPAGSALVTFLNGEKCLIKNWQFHYSVDYTPANKEVNGYVVVSFEQKNNEMTDDTLRIKDFENQERYSISKSEINQIQYYYETSQSPTPQSVGFYWEEGENTQIDSNGDYYLFHADPDHEWDWQAPRPDEISIAGTQDENCNLFHTARISINWPGPYDKYRLVRVEFF